MQPGYEGRKEGNCALFKIKSSMPLAAYQRLAANPTIHMQMSFLGSTGLPNDRFSLY
jgi:hypothetical protein